MEILARAVGRRKEAVAQVQLIRGTGQFFINTKSAHEYLQNDSCSILDVQAPFDIFKKNSKGLPSEVNNLKTNGALSPITQSSESLTPVALNQGGFAEPSTNNAFSASEFSSNSTLHNVDTIVKVKGGGLKGQAEAIRLGIARALCVLETHSTNAESLKDNQENNNLELGLSASGQTLQQAVLTLATSAAQNQPNVGLRKQLKDKGYLTQDSRVKERRKYGLKKARKASQYHKR